MGRLQLLNRLDALIRLFLYILIFWLPYSPAVIESCVIICVILWLLKRGIIFSSQQEYSGGLKEKFYGFLKAFRPEPTFLNKPIGLFLFACTLSVTSSAFFAQSLHNLFTKTLEWFVIYFLVVEVFKNKKHIYIALGICAFTAFSTALDGLVQFYITNKDIFLGHVIEPRSRATAGFKTSNGLGGYLTVVIPGLLSWIILGRQKFYYRIICAGIICFTVWSLFVTYSRGAWIGTFFGGIFLLFSILLPKRRMDFYLSLGIFGAIVILYLTFAIILTNSSGQEFLGRYHTIQWRLDLWKDCIPMIKDKLFFGHGINTFMKVFQVYRGNLFMDPTYAHNCYLQLAAETGIVGLLFFLWIIGVVFHQPLGKIKLYFNQDRNLAALIIGLLSGIFAFLIYSFFDTSFYSLQLSVYLWFIFGLLVSICKILDTPTV